MSGDGDGAMPGRACVRVPASTSNLGGGFDCVGMALPRCLEASVAVCDDVDGGPAVTMARHGALAALDALAVPPAGDLLHAGFAAACAHAGCAVPARVAYEAWSDIPVARGLGSSAAALVAGARLASDALGLGLAARDVAALVAEFEGHPDNAGPAALGGAVLGAAVADDAGRRGWAFSPLAVHPRLAFVFAVPDFAVATAAARAVLPATVPHADAVRAAARGAALVQGLATGDAALLRVALDDVLHVPHRRHLIPGYDVAVAAAREGGAFGATLSGSGSSLVAIADVGVAARVADAMRAAWEGCGATVETFVVREPARVEASGAG